MLKQTLLLAGLVVGGCVGALEPSNPPPGDDPPPGGDPPPGESLAKAMYESDVHPIMTAKCGLGCHMTTSASATPFVAPDVASSYVTVTGFTSVVGNFTETGAPIVTKITTSAHNGRSYTPEELSAINGWLLQEVTERQAPVEDPTDPPPPSNETPGAATARIISEWSGCLSVDDFINLDFGGAWANKGSNQGNCEQCHVSGAYGFRASDDNQVMYDTLSTNKYYMMVYFLPDISDPNLANAKMVPNYLQFERVGLRQVPHQDHPAFNTDPNDGAFQALQSLYDATMARRIAGACGPALIAP